MHMEYYGIGIVVILYWTWAVIPYMDYLEKIKRLKEEKKIDKTE